MAHGRLASELGGNENRRRQDRKIMSTQNNDSMELYLYEVLRDRGLYFRVGRYTPGHTRYIVNPTLHRICFDPHQGPAKGSHMVGRAAEWRHFSSSFSQPQQRPDPRRDMRMGTTTVA